MTGRRVFPALAVLTAAAAVWGADLTVGPADVRVDLGARDGYHLKIRKKPGIASVLLTESTEDPLHRADTFAYRSPDYNPINGDETRILDGRVLKQKGMYFLVDSTPEPDGEFGEAFHVFIPYVLRFGYPWSREGEVMALDGAYLSVRAFAKPYADYSGPFRDNPFVLRIVQKPLEGPKEENFMPAAVEEFSRMAEENEGDVIKTEGGEDMLEALAGIVDGRKGDSLDFVLVLDTTDSMTDDIPYLRRLLVPLIAERVKRYRELRIGLVVYRDYMEEYLVRLSPFFTDLAPLQKALNAVRVAGGRDIPEAVHEALDAAIRGYDWKAEDRIVVLVGDAPPHPRPRGKVTGESVREAARDKGIALYTIILPQ